MQVNFLDQISHRKLLVAEWASIWQFRVSRLRYLFAHKSQEKVFDVSHTVFNVLVFLVGLLTRKEARLILNVSLVGSDVVVVVFRVDV